MVSADSLCCAILQHIAPEALASRFRATDFRHTVAACALIKLRASTGSLQPERHGFLYQFVYKTAGEEGKTNAECDR